MRIGAGKSETAFLTPISTSTSMGTIVIGIIAGLLLIYLFATMIYPEHF